MATPKPEQPSSAPAQPVTKQDMANLLAAAKQTPQELERQQREDARRKREAAARVTPLVPIGDGNLDDAFQTERALEEAAKLSAEEKAAQEKRATDEYDYFVRCRTPHGKDEKGRPRSQIAIYLKRNPFADGADPVIKPNEWRATYKPTFDEPWLGEIVCQVCLRARDVEQPIDIEMLKRGTFRPKDRWTWRRPKNIERLKIEGETRASDVQFTSSNIGRAEAMERSRDAGLEVIA